MKRINRYDLDLDQKHKTVILKDEFSVVSAKFKGDVLCIWVEEEEENKAHPFQISMYHTRELIPDNKVHLYTALFEESYAIHLYCDAG